MRERDLAREREIAKAEGKPKLWRPPPTYAPRVHTAKAAVAWIRRREREQAEELAASGLAITVPMLEFT